MLPPENDPSRRIFLQQLGLGVAGMGMLALWEPDGGHPAHHHQPIDPCAPPAHGAPRPFVRDCRPVRPRQIANRLSAAEVSQLKAAYQAMRALDTSDPNDPRGFKHQANIHCFHCAGATSNQMHFTWSFFAWHRAYLYFHERILGKLIGNANFRLPFWGWDTSPYRTLPTPYVTPNDATNPLFNPTRQLTPGTSLPSSFDDQLMSDTLGIATSAEFVGTATDSGVPEGSPHGEPHVYTGGDMGFFASAAKDPVFYAHHATLDKMWSDWNKSSSTHTNPIDAAFLNLTFSFFDENKVWRSIKASQVVDHERSLRYVYEPYRFWDILPCLIWRPIRTNWAATQRITISGNPALATALRGNAPLRLAIRGMRVPVDRSTIYRIYGNQAEAQADRGTDSPSFLGVVPVVLNSPRNTPPTRGTRNVNVTLRPAVRAALAQGASLQLFLVDANERAASKRVILVRAESVSLSQGEADEEK